MTLGAEVGLGPGDILLDGDPVPRPQFLARDYCGKKFFRSMSIVAKRLYVSRCHLVHSIRLSLGDIVLDGDPARSPLKGHSPYPIFG